MHNWVVFDADNTLWDVEHLYDNAREELCDYLYKKGANKKEVDKYQRERDKKLYETYKYSACRFPRSFEDTVIELLGTNHKNQDIVHVRNIASRVFENDPIYDDDLEHIFKEIKYKYNIGIITAGEKWVQENRLDKFHLRSYIDETLVVETKSINVYEEFIKIHSINASCSWMIGDSIRSDIIPAKEVGLNVIWYKTHNWLEHETLDKAPSGVFEISKLSEILDLI